MPSLRWLLAAFSLAFLVVCVVPSAQIRLGATHLKGLVGSYDYGYPPPGFTVTETPYFDNFNQLYIQTGASKSLTVNVTSGGSFAGTVSLGVSSSSGILASSNPSSDPTKISFALTPSVSLLNGGIVSVPLTLTVGSQVPTGTYRLIVGGSGTDSNYGPWSSQVLFTINVGPPMPAPTGLTATGWNQSVALQWNPVPGASSYYIYRSTSPGGEGALANGICFSNTAYVPGLTNGTTYYFKVAAVNSWGPGGLSNEASARPQPVPPAAPAGLSASFYRGSILLSWTGTLEPGVTYSVFRGTSAGAESTTALASGLSSTGFSDPAGVAMSTYYYVVKATNTFGQGAASNEASCLVPLAAPTNLAVTKNSGPVTLSWTGSVSALSYNLYRGTSSSGEGSTALLTGLTGTSVTDSGAVVGQGYYYQVTAVHGTYESPPSNEATTAPSVATFANANPTPVTGTTTTLSVLGADAGGAPSLTYTWATSGTPPAPVTFSANGTNAAKTVTATFTRSGYYSFQVTIRNAVGLTTTSSVGVSVVSTLQSCTVSPATATVPSNTLQQFSIVGQDQFGGTPATPPSVNWSVSGGGTIDSSGLFTAGGIAGGPFIVTASSSTLSGSASVRVGSLGLTGLMATAYSTNQISLGWNATSGASGYNVYRSATSGGPYASVAAGTHSLLYFDSALNSSTSYYYVVTVIIAGAESPLSNEAMATTFPTSAPPVVTPVYGYTEDGLRAWKTVGGTTTYFLYDGGVPVCELDGSGNVLATNTWGETGLLSRRVGSSSTSYAFDPSGNVAHRLDGSGNVLGSYLFDAFGMRTGTDSTADPYSGFGGQQGGYSDAESGLTLFAHRYYDTGQGRFLTRDPMGYGGGSNLYAYAANNPVMLSDPSGFCPDQDAGGPPITDADVHPGMHPGMPQNAAANNMINGFKVTAELLPVQMLVGPLANRLLDEVDLAVLTGPVGKYFQKAWDYIRGDARGGGPEPVAPGEPVAPVCPPLCFTAGTLVQMADGSVKPIEKVQVGDQVRSRDPQTGLESVKTVTLTIKRLAPAVVTVTLSDGKAGKVETLTCTPEHPLFVQGQGWVEAGSLGIGSSIVSRAGPLLSVQSVSWQRAQVKRSSLATRLYTVYNLTVEDDHTYFVGTVGGGTWVHNIPCGGRYKDVPANGGEVHHTPADSISPLSRGDGPGFRMDTLDHYRTGSWGSSRAAQAYRAAQQGLINSGRFDDAIQMDIDNVQGLFGNKYDTGILEMIDSL